MINGESQFPFPSNNDFQIGRMKGSLKAYAREACYKQREALRVVVVVSIDFIDVQVKNLV